MITQVVSTSNNLYHLLGNLLTRWYRKCTSNSIYIIIQMVLTVANSFWLHPFPCLPCWISLPKSSETFSCFNCSVSRSSLAVFFVVTCCLFCPPPPEMNFHIWTKTNRQTKYLYNIYNTLLNTSLIYTPIYYSVL